ncbi:hypothetical protein G6F46_010333 [Rhizopus delemar]|nr:hypothetical protein G6F46_010333 [Rhizopus delemar]
MSKDQNDTFDPDNQHAALQLRWLQTLLLPSNDESLYGTFVTNILRHCLSHFSYSFSHLPSLLLPNHRSTTVKSLGCFKTLFATIDKIDYKIDWNIFNSNMANEPSLTHICPDIIVPHLGFRPSRWASMLTLSIHPAENLIVGHSPHLIRSATA